MRMVREAGLLTQMRVQDRLLLREGLPEGPLSRAQEEMPLLPFQAGQGGQDRAWEGRSGCRDSTPGRSRGIQCARAIQEGGAELP